MILKNIAFYTLLLISLPSSCFSQTAFLLWQNGAPDAMGNDEKDVPTLTQFLPDQPAASGAAIIVCPGGGYKKLSKYEGEDYARFLSMHGITVFVLKYRLGADGYRHPAMLNDAARALRYVRANAAKWNLNPNKIGIMGSSAGGHLASTLMTHFDNGNSASSDSVERVSSRPSFGILCYPVISMGSITHSGSKLNLLGENPPAELIELLSNEKQVAKDTPPCFLWHTAEDKSVSVENSLEFAYALMKNNIPFDLHVYQNGKHGLGLTDKFPFTNAHPWSKDLIFWLKSQNVLTSP